METKTTIKERKDKVVTWVKENKVKLIAGGVLIGLTVFGIHKIRHTEIRTDEGERIGEIAKSAPIPEKLKELGVDRIDQYGHCVEFMTGYADASGNYPMKVTDLNKLVSGLKEIPGVTDDSDIWLMVSAGTNLGNI